MADFETAYLNTAKNEGGYTEDPHPTAFGIDRKWHPDWPGWLFVDLVKADLVHQGIFNNKNMSVRLRKNQSFMSMVKRFFRTNFWLPIYNQIESQMVTNMVFDRGVNMDIDQAVKILQRVLGINDDGVFGKNTLSAVNSRKWQDLCVEYDKACDDFYRELAKDPKHARYKNTWVNRV